MSASTHSRPTGSPSAPSRAALARSAATALGLAALLACSGGAQAQGIVRGAQDGAAAGNKAAGPVGGAVGGAVGGVAGGVAGGVKGVLGIPQQSSPRRHARRKTAPRPLGPQAVRTVFVGHELQWRSADGSRTTTTAWNEDGSARLTNATNLDTITEDTGRWSLKGNRLCTTWDHWNAGNESCSTWTKTGARTYRGADGSVVTIP